ncbi:hypothetical protein EGW08_011409 [Elysia chlorotica]|uniref:Uncharacterized protein n=1 Tax=Elysia chlorotica TaxID=188477 RepID=A0A3S1HJN6_ELYCH|nr:hypothetical protein EGW08_011409 [Elysia chlorotica]
MCQKKLQEMARALATDQFYFRQEIVLSCRSYQRSKEPIGSCFASELSRVTPCTGRFLLYLGGTVRKRAPDGLSGRLVVREELPRCRLVAALFLLLLLLLLLVLLMQSEREGINDTLPRQSGREEIKHYPSRQLFSSARGDLWAPLAGYPVLPRYSPNALNGVIAHLTVLADSADSCGGSALPILRSGDMLGVFSINAVITFSGVIDLICNEFSCRLTCLIRDRDMMEGDDGEQPASLWNAITPTQFFRQMSDQSRIQCQIIVSSLVEMKAVICLAPVSNVAICLTPVSDVSDYVTHTTGVTDRQFYTVSCLGLGV